MMATAEHADDRLDQRADEHAHDHQRKLRERCARHRGAHAVTCRARFGVEQHGTRGERPAVAHHRRRVHHHARTEQVHAPTQVKFFTEKRDVRRETADLAEHVVAHQHARRRQREHVAHRIVLFLVALARIDHIHQQPRAVAVEPDVLQHVGRIPFHQLRADHGGVRAECLVDQRRHRIVAQRDVVVQHEEEPVAAVDQRQHLVDDGTKAGVALDGAHEGVGHDRADLVGHLGGRRARDEGDQREVRVVLAGDAAQGVP